MAVLIPSDIAGTADAVLINADETTLCTAPVASVDADFGGFPGDVHHGLTRASCVRVRRQYPVGTEIRNTRQVSILAAEDLAGIATDLGLDTIDPAWVGANLLISGIPKLTELPPSTRLLFPSGAALVVDMENEPCTFPGEVIESHHPGHGAGFVRAAIGRRGVTAWVERPGRIAPGDTVSVHLPPNRVYTP
ncbi:MAG: MOSC domain-containing protein [Pseudomonadota bacterium]